MKTQELIQSTISALALTSQPDNRTCKVKTHLPRESFSPLPYRYKMDLEKPLQAPSGTPVVVKMADGFGKQVSVAGVIADPMSGSEFFDCQQGMAVIIGTSDPISGNCVALEWNANAAQQAVGEKLKAMLMPDGITNPELFSKTFNLPHHVSIVVQQQPRAETSAISPSNPLISQANAFAKEPALPPTECEELEALHRETATKDVVFVLGAPDTILSPKVAAHLAQKFCAEGNSVLIVGRNSADVETAQREWAKGLTNIDGVSGPAGRLTKKLGLSWQGNDERLWDLQKRILEVDSQIAALISQSQVEPGGPESSDNLKELLAKRESFIKELQTATQEEIQSTPLVFANLDSALLCPALMGRKFDIVILLDANRMTIAEFIVLIGLVTTAVRVIGDCRQYPPVRPQPVSYEWERAVDEFVQWDVFGFCGVTRNLDNGVSDPRLAILRYQRNTHPEITEIISRIAYDGRLIPTRNSKSAEKSDSLQCGGVVVYDISSFAPAAYEFGSERSRFNPMSLALGMAAQTLRPSPSGDDNSFKRWATITPHRNQERLYEACLKDDWFGIAGLTLNDPLTNPSQLVILDLTDASGVTRPDDKLSGRVGSHGDHWLTKVITSARKQLVILADMPYLMRTLPAQAILRSLLREIKRISGPAIPFPENILTAPEFLESPGCSVYVNEAAALETMHRDIARAQSRVTWHWPRDTTKLLDKFPDGHLLIRGGGIKQSVVADLDIATVRSLARLGVRVTAPRQNQDDIIFADEAGMIDVTYRSPMEGRSSWEEDPRHCDDPCVLIDDNLLWLVGTAREEGRGRPYLRFKGSETFQLLTGFFGLDDQHSARVLDPSFA